MSSWRRAWCSASPAAARSYWAFENATAKSKKAHVVYLDYTGNTYRDFAAKIEAFYIRGGWDANRRRFLAALRQHHMVVWHPKDDADIQAMARYFWDLKEKHYTNVQEIWVYLDEIDLTADHLAPVEMLFTKARGCGIRPVGIAQRPSALRNRNIVDNAYGAVVLFRVEQPEVETLLDYGITVTPEDYAYIEPFKSYNAVLYDRTLHRWVRL